MISRSCWRKPSKKADLADESVHVWRVDLDQPREVIQAMEELLADDERERAKRFSFERDARRFRVSHGALRNILRSYLGINAKEVQFQVGKCGKPALQGEFADEGLFFNLAHSHEHALVAVTRSGEIGVDIEYLRSIDHLPKLSEQILTEKERVMLQHLDSNQQQQFFFRCWTRKEAIIKANGAGLTQSLDQVEVTFIVNETVHQPRQGEPSDVDEWRLIQIDVGMGYVGAVATRKGPIQIRYWQWNQADVSARNLGGVSAAECLRMVKGLGV